MSFMSTTTIKIEKPLYGGQGLGFHNGKAFFIRNSYPGDLIDVKILSEKKDYTIGEINKLLESSPERTEAVCKNFGKCGGCCYLNIQYSYELSLKKDILIDAFKRIGAIDLTHNLEINIFKRDRYHYRSHGTVKQQEEHHGFFKQESNELVPFAAEGCYLLPKEIITAIKQYSTIQKEYRVALDHNNNIFFNDTKKVIKEIECNITYERDINLFFQGNRYLRGQMLHHVGSLAQISENDHFIDIGCGVGFFTIYLGKNAKSGIGFDINNESIEWARKNAILNDVTNVRFQKKNTDSIHPFKNRPQCIILDPPRAGISKKGRKTIIAIEAPKIIYISCNPSTLARDIRDFTAAGYKLKDIALFDMFPGTSHIEAVTLLEM